MTAFPAARPTSSPPTTGGGSARHSYTTSRDATYKMHDARALALLVAPTGSRLWRFNYRFGGKQQSLALGAYPDVSLVRARELRDEARAIHLDRRRVELTPAETAELRAFLDATRNLHTKVSSC